MKALIYQLKSPSNKVYIGSTTTSLKQRIDKHIYYLKNNKHYNFILQAAWNKYNKLEVSILEEFDYDNRKQVITREQHYIDLLKPDYNILKEASTPLHNEETRRKIKETLTGRKHTPERVANITLAREKSKAKAVKEGRVWMKHTKPVTDRRRDSARKNATGKIKSAETKKRMSISQKKASVEKMLKESETLDELIEWVAVEGFKFDGVAIWKKNNMNPHYSGAKTEIWYTTKQVVDEFRRTRPKRTDSAGS